MVSTFRQYQTVFILFILAAVVSTFIFQRPSYANSYDEIQNQIDEKSAYLDDLNAHLGALDNEIAALEGEHSGLSSGISQIENEIAQYNAKIKKNETIILSLEEEITLKELELKLLQLKADEKVRDLYISSRQSKIDLIISNGAESFLDEYGYQSALIGNDISDITTLSADVDSLKAEKNKLDKEIQKYSAENESLTAEMNELESQLELLSQQLYSTVSYSDGIRAEIGAVQGQLGDLLAEQQAILNLEFDLMKDNPDMAGGPIDPGDFYFVGQGRDIYQGHGLGMSQWGAHGAALSGMSSSDIIKFYYTGVSIEANGNGTVEVIGVGSMNIETYVAGLGEVPDKACGTQSQAQGNPAKYVTDNPSTAWDCWPEESIKAQVIAARSYALSKGAPLYPDARDQVYKGGNGKQWAVNETTHQVARYGGGIIRAFYSSDNNQGAGTANHETIWSDYEGNKNPLPYLRSVNDNSFATKTQWTQWAYTTGGFTYEELNAMLVYERDNLGYAQAFLTDVVNSVGTVTSIDFVRDPSQRVWKVTLHGTSGSRVIAGWLFKALWNHAAANGQTSGFIYSLTFSVLQKPL